MKDIWSAINGHTRIHFFTPQKWHIIFLLLFSIGCNSLFTTQLPTSTPHPFNPDDVVERAKRLLHHVEYHQIPHAGHLGAWDNPEFVNAKILSFLGIHE